LFSAHAAPVGEEIKWHAVRSSGGTGDFWAPEGGLRHSAGMNPAPKPPV